MMENVTHNQDHQCSHCIDECDLIRYHVENIEKIELGTNHAYLFSPELGREVYNYTTYYRYEKLAIILVFQEKIIHFYFSVIGALEVSHFANI